MFWLLNTVLVAQILFTSCSNVSLATDKRRPDCSSIIQSSTLDNYKHVCALVLEFDPRQPESLALGLMNRLDLLEQCSCILLSHTLAWESMITHEVDTLFHSVQELIRVYQAKKKIGPISRDNPTLEDETMFFIDSLNSVLRAMKPRQKARNFSTELVDIFSQIYYDPETLNAATSNDDDDEKGQHLAAMQMVRIISTTCNNVVEQSIPFFVYFTKLNVISGNPRYMYRLVSYDRNIFKVLTSLKVCQFLAEAKQLL